MRLTSSVSSTPPSSVWYGMGKTSRKKDVGGYEVRRRDWSTLRDCPSRGWSRARWDEMTVYMVRFALALSKPAYLIRFFSLAPLGMYTTTVPYHRGYFPFR